MTYLWMLLLFSQGVAEPGPSDIKVDFTESVTVVSLPLRVQRQGKQLKNLNVQKLEILENGVAITPRDMVEVKTALTLHLLFDLSTSSERNIILARRAAKDLVNSMEPGDLTKISFFSSTYQPLTDYTSDRKELTHALGLLTPVGSTALYDGMHAALKELGGKSGTRILVLFSDGHDLISGTVEDDLLDQARNLRIPIFFAKFKGKKATDQPLLVAQSNFMESLVQASGGQTIESLVSFDRELMRLVGPYRERYLVRYEPPAADDLEQWRSLLVRIPDCPECDLEYRRAYSISSMQQ